MSENASEGADAAPAPNGTPTSRPAHSGEGSKRGAVYPGARAARGGGTRIASRRSLERLPERPRSGRAFASPREAIVTGPIPDLLIRRRLHTKFHNVRRTREEIREISDETRGEFLVEEELHSLRSAVPTSTCAPAPPQRPGRPGCPPAPEPGSQTGPATLPRLDRDSLAVVPNLGTPERRARISLLRQDSTDSLHTARLPSRLGNFLRRFRL